MGKLAEVKVVHCVDSVQEHSFDAEDVKSAQAAATQIEA